MISFHPEKRDALVSGLLRLCWFRELGGLVHDETTTLPKLLCGHACSLESLHCFVEFFVTILSQLRQLKRLQPLVALLAPPVDVLHSGRTEQMLFSPDDARRLLASLQPGPLSSHSIIASL